MTEIIITLDDSSSEAKVKIENTRIAVDIEYGGEKYSFNTHRDDPLRRMFLDFCDRLNLTYANVKFTLLGGRDRHRVLVNENQTAEDLGMSDGDTIHASQENTTRIRIDVHIQYKGEKYSFNTHKDDPLHRMFLAFCHSRALAYDAIRFSVGRRGRDRDRARATIKETQTADELGIGDGDTIYAEDTKIVVHVRHIGNKGECSYAIRRHVPLRKMFLHFCNRLDVSYFELSFVFHGIPVCETRTPDQLGMDDDDLIDALDVLYG